MVGFVLFSFVCLFGFGVFLIFFFFCGFSLYQISIMQILLSFWECLVMELHYHVFGDDNCGVEKDSGSRRISDGLIVKYKLFWDILNCSKWMIIMLSGMDAY